MASSGEDTMNVLAPYNGIRHVSTLPASDLTMHYISDFNYT